MKTLALAVALAAFHGCLPAGDAAELDHGYSGAARLGREVDEHAVQPFTHVPP